MTVRHCTLLSLIVLLHEPRGLAADRAAFLERHCLECHDADSKKGGLDLTSLKLQFDQASNFDTWVRVHDALANGKMPPKSEPRPDGKALGETVASLADDLTTSDESRQRREGRTGVRRLSGAEFENTLRDLLAVPGLRVLNNLPADGKSHGFDRSPEALDFSYVHLAEHLAAVDAALDAATPAFAEKPPVFTYRWYPWEVSVIRTLTAQKEAIGLVGLTRDETFSVHKVSGIIDDEPKSNAIGLFRIGDASARYRLSPYAPMLNGWHRLRVSGYSFGWDGQKVVSTDQHGAMSFGILSRGEKYGTVDLPPNKAGVVELTAWLDRGGGATPGVADQLSFIPETCEALPHYAGGKNGIREDVIGPPHPAPGVAVEWIEIEGPLYETWPPASQRAMFGELPVKAWTEKSGVPKPVQQAWQIRSAASLPKDIYGSRQEKRPAVHVVSADPTNDASLLLGTFLKRAFRRSVTDLDVKTYLAIFAQRIQAGDHFQDALKASYRAALTSPDFMLLGGTGPGALASRLSYFLWAGPPDEELLELAERGELQQPAVLRAQAERLLRDPKSARFVENFTGQWLRLREIDATQPDKGLYPEFTSLLQESMVSESRAFFTELLQKDLGVDRFVKSDFAMLNQILARHYGIPGVVGHDIRRVALPADSLRGPFITQASVLKVTANGTTTSPVRRGAFVMEKILGIVPQPPPPGAGSIEPDTRGTTTIREQLAKHKTNAQCASCHAKMDPYGFALESFDVAGEWRDQYRATGAKGREEDRKIVNGRGIFYHFEKPVDASGELPDGRAFHDVRELRDMIAADERSLARAFVGHLVTYATGAPVSFADRREVERILEHARTRGYGVRTLLVETIVSPLFAKP